MKSEETAVSEQDMERMRLLAVKLLSSPCRSRLFDCVRANPGITFSQAIRQAGVPAGSGRHHVSKLVEAGLLLEQRLRSTVRLFENCDPFHSHWQNLATLRDRGLRELHDWMLHHPASSQSAIIQAFTVRGWSRSTTQCRIEHL